MLEESNPLHMELPLWLVVASFTFLGASLVVVLFDLGLSVWKRLVRKRW